MYRILIVEDDSTIAEALKRHLEGWDHETVIAEDFKNIMAEYTRVEPDLVLLDIGLPFYNGFYWGSQIRQVWDVRADHFYLLCQRQYEHCHGHEHGRG